GTLTINKATLLVSASAITGIQYSDIVPAFSSIITGYVNGDGASAVSGSPSYATNASIGINRAALSGPGTYNITPAIGSLSAPNYSFSFLNGTLGITQEDARIDYTGDQILATPTATSNSATVTLRANILDITAAPGDPAYDANAGDIRNAKVRFVNRDLLSTDLNYYLSPWIPVTQLVDASNTKVGTASFPYTITLASNEDDKEITVGVVVDGYYTRDNTSDNVVVTVYRPNGDFITGGGTITPTLSVGSMKSDIGAKTNFGFNVKFNKSGTNLKGNMNIIFLRTENDGKQHVYQIKANAMQSLGVNATNPNSQTANYVSKTNLTDITNPNATISMGGNKLLYVNMVDNGEPGKNDLISFVLVDGNNDPTVMSNIIYSSNWVNNKTQMMNLSGGNLVVHSGFNLGSASTNPATMTVKAQDPIVVPQIVEYLAATAYPNPSASQFTIHVQSSNTKDAITMKVVDMYGRLMETRSNLSDGQTLQVGGAYRSGIYLIELIQNGKHKQVKLIKQQD
ncbi:MAG: T9SS type A sorting domain-containing protein, partial [Bacteroidota bacterium]|nr:T9SS type A sorting domain-containing protein [Bacteroidota bacterium]